jgi:hypothetical protein
MPSLPKELYLARWTGQSPSVLSPADAHVYSPEWTPNVVSIQRHTPLIPEPLLRWTNGWVTIQMSPGLASAEVNNHNAVPPFDRRIRDICHTLSGGRKIWSKVEPHIVQVRVGEGNGGREQNRLDDCVVRQVDSYELRTTIGCFH